MKRSVPTAIVVATAMVQFFSDSLAQPVPGVGMYEAIRRGDLAFVEGYLSQGGDPNAYIADSPMGRVSLLGVAVAGRREAIALALLEAGAELDASGVAFSGVAGAGMDTVLGQLLTTETLADQQEIQAALDIAVVLGHFDSVAVLLAQLRETNVAGAPIQGDSVTTAVGRGHDDIARLLIESGAPVNGSALREASSRSSPGMVRELLRRGANPFEEYSNPRSNGRQAQRGRYTAIDLVWEVVEEGTPAQQRVASFKLFELMSAGVVSERVDPSLGMDGEAELSRIASPSERLQAAVEWGFYDTVRELVESRAVGQEVLTEATTAAIRAGWDDIARLLLSQGAPPGGGPLHAAVRHSSPGMVRYLLALGADPDELLRGYRPIHYWLRNDPAVPPPAPARGGTNPEVLEELVKGGAHICPLVEYRDELIEQPFSFGVLWNLAPHCWPEQQ